MWEIEKVLQSVLPQVDLIEIYQQLDHTYTVELHAGKEVAFEEKKGSGFCTRCMVKNRKGIGYANTARKAVFQALQSARESPVPMSLTLPEGPFTYPSIKGLASSATLSQDDFIDHVNAAELTGISGSITLLHRKIRLINSTGVKAQKSETLTDVYLLHREKDYQWREHTQSRELITVDTLEEMRKSVSEAKRMKKANSLEGEGSLLVPGHLSSHLYQTCVSPYFQVPSMLDKQIFSQDISLVDDGTLPGGIYSAPFDDEGVPCKRRNLVEKGMVKDIMLNSSQAAKHNTEASGNMTRTSWQSSPRLAPHNLIFCEGQSKEELKESFHGIAATNFKAFIPLLSERHTRNILLVMNGFFIRNGDIQYPVTNVKVKFDFFSLNGVSKPYQRYQQPYVQDLLFESVKFL